MAGTAAGRVRAMLDDIGDRVKEAEPSTPVLTMGWDELPAAGDRFEVVGSEKEARAVGQRRSDEMRQGHVEVPNAREARAASRTAPHQRRGGVAAHRQGRRPRIARGDPDSLVRIEREGGRITLMHRRGGDHRAGRQAGRGHRRHRDRVRGAPDAKARKLAEQTGIEIGPTASSTNCSKRWSRCWLAGWRRLRKKRFAARPRSGRSSGCPCRRRGRVLRHRGGDARRRAPAPPRRRRGVRRHGGLAASLQGRRAPVAAGFECGIGLAAFNDIKEGDVIEVYEVREVPRT